MAHPRKHSKDFKLKLYLYKATIGIDLSYDELDFQALVKASMGSNVIRSIWLFVEKVKMFNVNRLFVENTHAFS